jgi:hypothetical protein
MPKIVRFHETGGPEVLKLEEVTPGRTREGRSPHKSGGHRTQPGRDHVPEGAIS